MAVRRHNYCGSPEHGINRRGFLGGLAVGTAGFAASMTGLSVLTEPAVAAELKKQQKRCILLWLAGGASQLETWDPKPGVETGGPFSAIPTSVPGVHISELMPKMAQRMNHTCIIRSLNTRNGDHGSGAQIMMRGRRDEPGLKYPDLGAVCAKELGRFDSQVPDYVSFYLATEGQRSAPGSSGFLGARYAPMEMYNGLTPDNVRKQPGISDLDHVARADLRDLLSRRFSTGRSSATLASHNEAYQRVRGLMASERLFDVTK